MNAARPSASRSATGIDLADNSILLVNGAVHGRMKNGRLRSSVVAWMAASGGVFRPSVLTVNETPHPEVLHRSGGPRVRRHDSSQARSDRPAALQLPCVLARPRRAAAFKVLPRQRGRGGVRHAAGPGPGPGPVALRRRDAPTTFGAIAARWLAVKAATKRKSTVVFYESTLRNHVMPAFAHTPVAAITRADVQDWIKTLTAKCLAANTIRQIYRAVFKSHHRPRPGRRTDLPHALPTHRATRRNQVRAASADP